MPHSIFFKFMFCGRIIKIQNTLPVLCNLDMNQFSLTDVHPNLDSALPAFLSLPPVSSHCKAVRKKECVCLLQHKGWGAGEIGYCCIQVLQCRPVLEPGQVMWNSDNGNLEHMEIQLALHICHGWVSHIRTHTCATDTKAVEVLSSAMFRGEIPHLTLKYMHKCTLAWCMLTAWWSFMCAFAKAFML